MKYIFLMYNYLQYLNLNLYKIIISPKNFVLCQFLSKFIYIYIYKNEIYKFHYYYYLFLFLFLFFFFFNFLFFFNKKLNFLLLNS